MKWQIALCWAAATHLLIKMRLTEQITLFWGYMLFPILGVNTFTPAGVCRVDFCEIYYGNSFLLEVWDIRILFITTYIGRNLLQKVTASVLMFLHHRQFGKNETSVQIRKCRLVSAAEYNQEVLWEHVLKYSLVVQCAWLDAHVHVGLHCMETLHLESIWRWTFELT